MSAEEGVGACRNHTPLPGVLGISNDPGKTEVKTVCFETGRKAGEEAGSGTKRTDLKGREKNHRMRRGDLLSSLKTRGGTMSKEGNGELECTLRKEK